MSIFNVNSDIELVEFWIRIYFLFETLRILYAGRQANKTLT